MGQMALKAKMALNGRRPRSMDFMVISFRPMTREIADHTANHQADGG